MQKARRHPINRAPTACRRMVSGTISLPSSGCFSPFPHGTRALSVSREYLALPDGPGGFAQDSSCPALLRIPLGLASRTGFSPSVTELSRTFRSRSEYCGVVLQPPCGVATAEVWALPRSLATTGGIISLFSLPRGTKMFQFPRFAPPTSVGGDSPSGCRVVPFGNPRVNGHLHLTAAYRSLSRPSSPP